jgi:copper chaperone
MMLAMSTAASSPLSFEIPAMTCGHCVRAITEAVKAVDPQAEVTADLPQHRVTVASSATRAALVASLDEAGYTPA